MVLKEFNDPSASWILKPFSCLFAGLLQFQQVLWQPIFVYKYKLHDKFAKVTHKCCSSGNRSGRRCACFILGTWSCRNMLLLPTYPATTKRRQHKNKWVDPSLKLLFVPVIEIQIISDGIHDHSATLAALQTILLMFEVFINLKKKSRRHFKFWFLILMPWKQSLVYGLDGRQIVTNCFRPQ
jgi:hypothetical protein